MSIHLAVKLKEIEQRVAELERLMKSNALQEQIDSLKSKLDAPRPQRGRPPKDKNG